MIRDLYSDIKLTQAISCAVRTADANGVTIDTLGYDSGPVFVATVGVSGDTLSGSVFIELEVEDSPDNSVWTDVPNANLKNFVTGTNVGTFAVVDDAAEDDAVYICEYRGNQRYVRAVINLTGTHTLGTPIGIVAVQGHAHQKPVNT